MSRDIAMYAISLWAIVGAYGSVRFLWRRWLIGTRGEYHCSECGYVSSLPPSEEGRAHWKLRNGGRL